ncbi:MAG: hypothetical protein VKL39_24485, partial [Leptolyngbyaceae bacterium]|nr:hypothetical protein [Leptolyngbyaceae bacterium]
ETITVTSSNEAVATVEGTTARHVSDGSATITLSAPCRTLALPLTFASQGGVTSTQFSSYVNGSAARHASDQIDTRLAGKSAASALAVYTTQDHASGIYVRNPSLWCADVDLTAVSPWNSTDGVRRAGVLISPRHVLFAAHYQPDTGATIRFIAADNTVVTRTISNKTTFPGYIPYHPDFTIGVLDSDVPASIGFAKVLPASYATSFPGAAAWGKVASLCFDQEEKALVQDWRGAYSLWDVTVSAVRDYCGFNTPTDAKRLEFFENKITGDSGNPAFLIINGELVLLTVLTYGGAGAGTELPPRIATLNSMMASLGGGYSLTEVDLSGFPTYP